MKHQLQTIRAALEPFAKDAAGIHLDWADERIRNSLTGSEKITVGDMRRAAKALTALSELERMVGEQEPVAWQILNGVCHAGIRSSEALAKEAAAGMQKTHDLGGSLAAFHVRPLYTNAPVAQQPQEIEVQCPVCNHKFYEWPNDQQPQARPDFNDEWTGYLKDGETPFERFLRERKDLDALTKLYQRALEGNERLKAQQPQAEAVTENTSDGYHTFKELYAFRKAYNAALFNEWAQTGKCQVHKSWRHHGGELCFGGGWFIVVAVLPDGQISNHYEAKDWELFNIPETAKALYEFDGHTGADVIARLEAFKGTAPQQAEAVPSDLPAFKVPREASDRYWGKENLREAFNDGAEYGARVRDRQWFAAIAQQKGGV